jgi:hypothetical protein
MEVSGQLHATAALTPYRGKNTRHNYNRRVGGGQGRSAPSVKHNLPLPGIESRSSNPQVSHYTDWATTMISFKVGLIQTYTLVRWMLLCTICDQ